MERNCRIFLLSTDRWTQLREFRNRLETVVIIPRQIREEPSTVGQFKKYADVEGVILIADENLDVSRKLGVLCEGKGDEKVCYPGYMLLTPDKELVQYCILKNNEKLFEKTEKTQFSYPLTDEVMDALVDNLDVLMPIHNMVKRLKETYPRASFGTFVDNMIVLVQKEDEKENEEKKEKKSESIFKWRGWGDIFGEVLGGNLK